MKNHWLKPKYSKIVSTTTSWDFQTVIGDTIKEKYKDLYIQLVEVSNLSLRRPTTKTPQPI